MWLTCARTVPGAMNSSWAISACDRPAAMSVRMFISRLLRFSNFSGEPSSRDAGALFDGGLPIRKEVYLAEPKQGHQEQYDDQQGSDGYLRGNGYVPRLKKHRCEVLSNQRGNVPSHERRCQDRERRPSSEIGRTASEGHCEDGDKGVAGAHARPAMSAGLSTTRLTTKPNAMKTNDSR